MDLDMPRIGTRMGKYQVGNMIGSGVFGMVFEVSGFSRSRVLKIRHVSKFSALQQEMNMCNRLLNVGGIPRVHDIGTSGNYCWMVMDHVGISLHDIFQRIEVISMPQNRRVNVVAFLGSQILGRLRQIHSQGVVHGDIQPGNITLCLNDRNHIVHLIDFGSATMEGEPRSDINIYVASAQHCTAILEDRDHPASRADDIVSLAFLLIQMVTGRNFPWEALLTPHTIPVDSDLEEVIRYKQYPPKSMTKGVHRVFRRFLKYALKLSPYEEIDYIRYINTLYQFSLREFQTPQVGVQKIQTTLLSTSPVQIHIDD